MRVPSVGARFELIGHHFEVVKSKGLRITLKAKSKGEGIKLEGGTSFTLLGTKFSIAGLVTINGHLILKAVAQSAA